MKNIFVLPFYQSLESIIWLKDTLHISPTYCNQGFKRFTRNKGKILMSLLRHCKNLGFYLEDVDTMISKGI